MITVTEAASLGATQAHFKALKPWWDVLMDSLLIIMLMVSFFSATLLIITDKVVCMPRSTTPHKNKSGGMDTVGSISSATPKETGHLTNLDYQQYMYVSVVCYHKVVPWQSKYFPYLTLVNSLLLLVSSNFWFKYPKTSSKVDHFLSILAKCFESPWTTKALEGARDQPHPEPIRQKSSGSHSVEYSSATPLVFSFPRKHQPISTILDKKEEQQAKALFERIRHFRVHAEDSDVVYRVYVGQTVIKVVKVTIVLGYAFSLMGSFSFQHICKPGIQNLMGYSEFTCTHNLAYILEKLLLTYILLVCMYAFLSVFALIWLFWHPLKVYSFDKIHEGSGFGDISDAKNDLAFMLHMADCYDSLYSRRFSVFLSAVSEGRLNELAVNTEWTEEKIRVLLNKDSNGRCELRLSMIPAIPIALYNLTEIEVLKLELISCAKILGAVSNLRSLSEIHLLHCPVKVDPDAYRFLQECLKVLYVWFTDLEELPSWVYSMKNLQQLHLTGNLNSSNNKSIRLQTLRGLTGLRVLSLTSNLSYLPTQIFNIAGQLHELRIHNGGAVLCSFGQLKKMSNLTALVFQHCQITGIPTALPSLTNLQSLDLTSNLLQSVEELGHQHRFRSLRALRLCHNDIKSLHPSIENLYNLEEFSVSHNSLESLPASVFNLVKLRHFDISNNRIRVIPPEVGYLSRLELLAATGNQISSLPTQLFRCTRLRSLKVGRNKLSRVPPEVKQLTLLSTLELSGNNLTTLPVEIACCSFLKKRGLDVEESVLDTLPLELRSTFL